jgi:hypothetical protein
LAAIDATDFCTQSGASGALDVKVSGAAGLESAPVDALSADTVSTADRIVPVTEPIALRFVTWYGTVRRSISPLDESSTFAGSGLLCAAIARAVRGASLHAVVKANASAKAAHRRTTGAITILLDDVEHCTL